MHAMRRETSSLSIPEPSAARWRTGRLRVACAAAARVLRRVIGAPDYERYLSEHARRAGAHSPMTCDEFTRDALARRYERPGSRCC